MRWPRATGNPLRPLNRVTRRFPILKEQIAVCARNQHKPVTEKIKINRSGDTVLDPVVSAQKIKINPFGESLNELAGMAISLASHLYQGAYQRTSSTAALTESEQTTEKE